MCIWTPRDLWNSGLLILKGDSRAERIENHLFKIEIPVLGASLCMISDCRLRLDAFLTTRL
jgi:hypothetical protein